MGLPLQTPQGESRAMLCLIDHEPGSINAMQKDMLRELANEIVSQLELKAALFRLEGNSKAKDKLKF